MSAPKPFSRRRASVSRIAPGLTISTPLSRKYSVSRIEPSSASRSSWARSSRPVASGTVRASRAVHVDRRRARAVFGLRELLGAARAVALAPAHVGVVLDHLAQLQDPVHERLGRGGQPGT